MTRNSRSACAFKSFASKALNIAPIFVENIGSFSKLKIIGLDQCFLNEAELEQWSRGFFREGHRIVKDHTPNFCRVETVVNNTVLLESQIKKTILTGISAEKPLLTGKVL